MTTILDAAKRAKEFIAQHKDDPEVKALCADLRDVYAAIADGGDEEELAGITSVDPDVLKAIDLSESLVQLEKKRERASAFMRFGADLLQIFLASKGLKL